MNNKGVLENQQAKKRFNWFKGFQYWIAAISYLIIVSLSILCLVAYVPDLSGGDVLDSGTLNLLKAMLIIMLVAATAFFWWETRQWRRRRVNKNQQSSLEDIIKGVKKDSNSSQ